jgi:hypothetical protein
MLSPPPHSRHSTDYKPEKIKIKEAKNISAAAGHCFLFEVIIFDY